MWAVRTWTVGLDPGKPPMSAEKATKAYRMKKLSTLHVARLLGVSHQSIANWIDSGKLRAGKTPGGHRRVSPEDLVTFLKKQKLDIPAELNARSRNILIVDEDPAVGQSLTAAIAAEYAGWKVLLAHDGWTGGETLVAERPELVILDLHMPGMDGFEICQRIKSNVRTKDIMVIAVAAHPSVQAQEAILKAGAVALLPKPIDTAHFLGVMRGLLSEAQ
jgi:two-component system, OmpR family, response regulator VicR